MKYSYPNYTLSVLFTAMFILLVTLGTAQVQTTSELVFKNATLESNSPSDGKDGAIYRFPAVQTGVDALVKIGEHRHHRHRLGQGFSTPG
jgi:hypothetical protein